MRAMLDSLHLYGIEHIVKHWGSFGRAMRRFRVNLAYGSSGLDFAEGTEDGESVRFLNARLRIEFLLRCRYGDTLSAGTLEQRIRWQREMTTSGAEEPVAAHMPQHLFEGFTLHTVRTAENSIGLPTLGKPLLGQGWGSR